jgi:hypothetical protein
VNDLLSLEKSLRPEVQMGNDPREANPGFRYLPGIQWMRVDDKTYCIEDGKCFAVE